MPARTASDFAIMLDRIKPVTFTGTFGSAFSQAVSNEYIFTTTNHQGDTYALAVADNLERLIEEIDGQTYEDHGQRVIVADIGLSSSPVSGFDYGTAHFTTVMDWLTAVKAAADLEGKTVKIKGLVWAWGANSYAADEGYATAYAAINGYCGTGGTIDTYLLPILGQTDPIEVGFMSTHHHYQATLPEDPFVARAEVALAAAFPDRYSIIHGKGINHLNGLDRGFAGSNTHHHPSEEEFMAGVIAWWAHTRFVADEPWSDLVPSVAKTGARQLTLTISDFPEDAYFGFQASGLFPTVAQPSHGWWVCDQATPTTEVTLVRPPYAGATAGTLIIDTTADLPTNWEVRYGSRTGDSYLAGNSVIKFTNPHMVSVKGVDVPLYRNMAALRIQGT
jgi:hypothetical protein